MSGFISSSLFKLVVFTVLQLFATSCHGVDSDVFDRNSPPSIQILAVLPSQLFSFAPAVVSVIGRNFPLSCAVHLIPQQSNQPIIPIHYDSLLPSDSQITIPCNTSSDSQYLITFFLSAQIANAVQLNCKMLGIHHSKCSVDLAIFDLRSPSSSFASLELARMNDAIFLLLPPEFDTLDFRNSSRSTCPILVTGSRFISHPGVELACYTQRCNLQCGVHNYSTILLIPDAGCEGIGSLRVHVSFTWNATTAAEAWLDLSIVSNNDPIAPVCLSAMVSDDAATRQYFSTDCSDARHQIIWNNDHLQQLSDFNFTRHVSAESETASFFNFYNIALSRMPHLVTLVITMCNRPLHLQRMLVSFVKHNTYPISDCIIVEDHCSHNLAGWLDDFVFPIVNFPVQIIYNEFNIGQVASIDKAYSRVTTPWIFHCEEDWEFFRGGFIEESLRILQLEPTFVMVAIRAHDDLNLHPVLPPRLSASLPFARMYQNIYSGFGFHPGLRRTVDYLKVAPFECSVSWPYHFAPSGMPWEQRFHFRPSEGDIHKLYNKFGEQAVGAVTMEPTGYVRHTGKHDSTFAERFLPRQVIFHAPDVVDEP